MTVNESDRSAIRQAHIDLMNTYAHALDTRDWTLLRSLYIADAEFSARQYLDGNIPGEDDFNFRGADKFVGMLQTIWNNLSKTHHMISNYVVDVDADGQSAKASGYLRAYHAGRGDKAHLFEESLGRFDFHTVLVDGEWRIAAMEENIFIMLGTREVFGTER